MDFQEEYQPIIRVKPSHTPRLPIKPWTRTRDQLLRLDMQLSQKIKKWLIIYLNVNNLTNNPDRTILTYHPDRVTGEERYGVSGDIGLRFRF